MKRSSLTRFAWLSIAAGIATISLKSGAYLLTGSVGLLSDALESVVNLAAALVALAALIIAARPPDKEHEFGHDKVEYFSSFVEGTLILLAAASIAVTSINRLLHPQAIEQIGFGVVVSVLASLINLGVSRVLLKAGRQYNSITLEADARHLMTDVWTSAGVIIAIGAIAITGLEWLDPVIALVVAANIIWSGIQLIRRSAMGLLDTALPAAESAQVQAILDKYRQEGLQWHALRTRQSASRRFVSVHILVPDIWTVQQGHDTLERIEQDIRHALANVTLFTHLEPLGDPVSWQDAALDRSEDQDLSP